MIVFKTGRSLPSNIPIVKVGVERATDTSVFHWDEQHQHRRSSHAQFWNTFEEAKAYLVSSAEADLASAQRRVDQERSKLEKIKALKKLQSPQQENDNG